MDETTRAAREAKRRRERQARASPGSPEAPAGSGRATGIDDPVPDEEYGDEEMPEPAANRPEPQTPPQPDTYTAEVEFSHPCESDPSGNTQTVALTESNVFPHTIKERVEEYAATQYPDATFHRIGVWTGTQADRPAAGHERGILQYRQEAAQQQESPENAGYQ